MMHKNETEIAREYIRSALDLPIAYLRIVHTSDAASDPLDVEFFWDEKGFGSLAKMNLRDQYLEEFNDDPALHKTKMPGVIAALRKLADEIEAIHVAAST